MYELIAAGLMCLTCAGVANSDCHLRPEKELALGRIVNCGDVEKSCGNYLQITFAGRCRSVIETMSEN